MGQKMLCKLLIQQTRQKVKKLKRQFEFKGNSERNLKVIAIKRKAINLSNIAARSKKYICDYNIPLFYKVAKKHAY